jgi:site-specific DNA-cytosine methylase
VLTVRECARAQGFPDSWEFLSGSERPSTIVGDVSPVVISPVMLAKLLTHPSNSNSDKLEMRSRYRFRVR